MFIKNIYCLWLSIIQEQLLYGRGELLSKQSQPNDLRTDSKTTQKCWVNISQIFNMQNDTKLILVLYYPHSYKQLRFQLCFTFVTWFMIYASDWDIFKYLNWTSHLLVIYWTDLFSMEIHPLSRVTGKCSNDPDDHLGWVLLSFSENNKCYSNL